MILLKECEIEIISQIVSLEKNTFEAKKSFLDK